MTGWASSTTTIVASKATIQLCGSASLANTKPTSLRIARYSATLAAEKRRIGQAALDDDLDVAQPIAHDRGGKRQRHQTERHRGELQRERRIGAERPRQRVAERERSDTENGAPRDPAQLPPAGQRRDLAERARQHDRGGDGAQEQVDVLGPIEQLQRARERGTVCRAARMTTTRADDQRERRQVHDAAAASASAARRATAAARGTPA